MSELQHRHLYDADIALTAPISIGATPNGQRAIFPVSGGTIKGPRFSGRFIPPGGDWALVRSDGSIALDVRATVETDDGALIYLTYTGRIVADPALLPAVLDVAAAVPVDPSRYYFRTLVLFETGSADYAWLNAICAVGIGSTGNGGVQYRTYEIL